MLGIYRSSENDDLIKTVGPHKEITANRNFMFGNSITIEIDNFFNVNNVINFGESFSELIHIDITGPLVQDRNS